MPLGCLFYVDAKKPDNCQVRFDARLYEPKDMRALVDRYLRLLETASREPELPIGQAADDDRRQAAAIDVCKIRGDILSIP